MSTKPRLEPPMSADEFLEWAEQQDEDYELVRGRLVAMSGDRQVHNVTKGFAFAALLDAIRRGGVRCTPYSDGISVKTPDGTVRRPDASVDCGPFDADALYLPSPVIVVEVVSPSSEREDTIAKFADYFSIPSVMHFLIVLTGSRMVIHHARNGEAEGGGPRVSSTLHTAGELRLDPPGLVVPVADFFAAELVEG